MAVKAVGAGWSGSPYEPARLTRILGMGVRQSEDIADARPVPGGEAGAGGGERRGEKMPADGDPAGGIGRNAQGATAPPAGNRASPDARRGPRLGRRRVFRRVERRAVLPLGRSRATSPRPALGRSRAHGASAVARRP